MEPADAIEQFARAAAAKGQDIKRANVSTCRAGSANDGDVRQTLRKTEGRGLVSTGEKDSATATCEFWSPSSGAPNC